jgi:thiol-disulfide isomerase/thioredoxin
MTRRLPHFVFATLYAGLAVAIASTRTFAQSSIVRPTGTAAEYTRGIALYREGEYVLGVLRDQIDTGAARRARTWATSMQDRTVSGIQMDAMGILSVAAGYDDVARREFEARLSDTHLSVLDRAYTSLMAVEAFGANARRHDRMPVALEYLARLDALPKESRRQQFRAHASIAEAYYGAGDSPSVIAHLQHALALIPDIPFEERQWGLVIKPAFLMLADALSGTPNGRHKIDSLATWMRQYTIASPAILAKGTLMAGCAQMAANDFKRMTTLTDHLGRLAPVITAQYWINTQPPPTADPATPGARIKRLDDGKIRVLELGHYGCPGCLAALPKLERIRKAVPNNVEVWFVSDETQVWGSQLVTAAEKARLLEQFYVNDKGYGLPIAVWIGPRAPDVDGGNVHQPSPVVQAYDLFATPTFVVTDGRGIVRHIGIGSADSEARLKRTVDYLIAEAR